MAHLQTRDGTRLFYNDWGTGAPVILIHGWPLDHSMWAHQAIFLAEAGFRVIAYDRRGFGRSDQPWLGYDYDPLSRDLADLIEGLKLDQVSLVGFSMGGGEVARYLARNGSAKIRKCVLISAVTPYMLKSADNPEGVDRAVFDEMLSGLKDDRPAFLTGSNDTFFGNGLLTDNVSEETVEWARQTAMQASLRATLECAMSFATTDFRPDMQAFDRPTLLIHGTADQTVPIDSAGRIAARMIPGSTLIEYEREPHGLFLTTKDRLNRDMMSFLV